MEHLLEEIYSMKLFANTDEEVTKTIFGSWVGTHNVFDAAEEAGWKDPEYEEFTAHGETAVWNMKRMYAYSAANDKICKENNIETPSLLYDKWKRNIISNDKFAKQILKYELLGYPYSQVQYDKNVSQEFILKQAKEILINKLFNE